MILLVLKWLKNYSNTDWIYKNNSDNSARFVLGVKGQKPLIVFGINPSTASDKIPDHTLIRVEKLAYIKKYDSWIMLNLYPYRATDIKNLVSFDINLHNDNLTHIKQILDRFPNATILAAWGNINSKLVSGVKQNILNCLKNINEVVESRGRKWMALKDVGYPVHFLYTGKGFKLYKVNFVDFSPSL